MGAEAGERLEDEGHDAGGDGDDQITDQVNKHLQPSTLITAVNDDALGARSLGPLKGKEDETDGIEEEEAKDDKVLEGSGRLAKKFPMATRVG